MSAQLLQAIKHLHPDAVPGRDFMLRDDSDGNGVYLDEWHLDVARPTDEEIAQAITEISA